MKHGVNSRKNVKPQIQTVVHLKNQRVVILVKQMLEVVSISNDALDGYSVYTAALEKKLKIIPKKNDSEGKKESL